MESKNLAIGVLSITAVILLVGLIVINVLPAPARAGEASAIGGDFTVTVGRVTQDTELLYVLDNVTQRLLVYGFGRKTGAVAITDKQDLGQRMGR